MAAGGCEGRMGSGVTMAQGNQEEMMRIIIIRMSPVLQI